jgi:hypothetical protein
MGENSGASRPRFWREALDRAKAALIGLAIWIVLTLALVAWWQLAPETVPQLAFIILFGSVIGAPLVAMSIIISAMMEPTRDRGLPARDASEKAAAAIRKTLAGASNNRRSGTN